MAIIFANCIWLACLTSYGEMAGIALHVSHLCVVDGLKYQNIQSAVAGCKNGGIVVIPPTDSATEAHASADVTVLDIRHPDQLQGLTPVTDFGARGDAETAADGSSQKGSADFISASASFAAGRDEGKTIVITGAGDDNSSLTTTIRGVNSSSRVTLAVSAAFTASGLTYWYGSENTAAFQTAYRSGKLLSLPAGRFLLTGTIKGSSPLFLVGTGKQSTIIDDATVFELHGNSGHFLDNFRMEPATKLTAFSPQAFPTPHAGTPVAVDRSGAGIGYQPELQDFDIWPHVSKQQREQQIGPGILVSSDDTHIYRITGDLISILLFDVQFSEVALCDFRAGKNFAGGIVLWHTPHDGRMNTHDTIHDNDVRYASYNGIVWTAAEQVFIRHNHTIYNGESGFKNYSTQGDGTYDSLIEVIDNQTEHNHYDGFDLSEDYPHANSHRASSVVSGNTSSYNDRTGTYADGLGWVIKNNVFNDNGLSGMSLDVSDSVISENVLQNNNSLHDKNSHQMLIGPGRPSTNDLIEGNQIVGNADSGAAIKMSAASTGNKINDNTASGGALFWFGVAPAACRNNSDSHGPYPDK